ncbi:MAG: hypothetical protein WKF73_10760 [Nocardioidaceae bacterium]
MDLCDLGVLVDGHPHPLDDLGQSSDQQGGLDPRAVWAVRRCHRARDVDSFSELKTR